MAYEAAGISFPSACHFSAAIFTILEGAFLALRFTITTGGCAGGRSSTCMWSAKRWLPIWQMIVEPPGSSGGFGNGNTLLTEVVNGSGITCRISSNV